MQWSVLQGATTSDVLEGKTFQVLRSLDGGQDREKMRSDNSITLVENLFQEIATGKPANLVSFDTAAQTNRILNAVFSSAGEWVVL